jgi:hypothetical protein
MVGAPQRLHGSRGRFRGPRRRPGPAGRAGAHRRIGENSDGVRASVCQDPEGLGVTLSPKRNRARSGRPRRISADDAPMAVLVMPTDEELEGAEQTLAVAGG